MKKKYIIKCKSFGGVFSGITKTLKSNGKIKYFSSKESAEKEADKLNKIMNRGVGMGSTFHYWVEEV